MLKNPVYLVPYDFSKLASNAFKVAMRLAEANDGTVYVLHVVGSIQEKREAEKLLFYKYNTLHPSEQKRVIPKVMVGNLYKMVGIAADLLNAKLIVTATHGAKGIQRLLGSNALKLVSHSSSPFLLMVKEEELKSIETIVMPFSFVPETLNVLDALIEFAEPFQSVVHLVGYYDVVEWQNEKSKENQEIARQHLESHGLACEIVNLPKQKSYEEEISDYMFQVRADLIAASYFKSGIIPPPNSFMQVMLDNDHSIPVFTVNGDAVAIEKSIEAQVFAV